MESEFLTEEGLSYIDRLSDLYSDAESKEQYQSVRDYFDFEVFDSRNWPPVGRMPNFHDDYGKLMTDNEDLVLKLRNFGVSSRITAKNENGHYQNQNFVEAYIWLEERSDDSNFARVRAFDAEDGDWLLMDEVDQQLPVHSSHLDWVKDYMREQGWRPHDLEIGLSGDNWKVIDYGRFEPLEEWRLTEEEVLNSEIAVRDI